MPKRIAKKAAVSAKPQTVSTTRTGSAQTKRGDEQPLPPVWENWSKPLTYALLTAAVLICLLPFSGRAFHVDDPLFVWAAQQIAKHPLDPYGFQVVWYLSPDRMSDVTQNPPLASYYAALIGVLSGWSELSLHLGFLLPAIAVTLGTYRLAMRFTRLPFLAAVLGLLTPATLVCAASVMCDTLMLAFGVWAINLWIDGLETKSASRLFAAGLLLTASILTKYFAAAFIPLLLVYSVLRERRLGNWAWYLLIPIGGMLGYEFWTQHLYGRGLISGAASYASTIRTNQGASTLGRTWGALSFLGGCMLSALTFVPMLWRRRTIVIGAVIVAINGFGVAWANFGVKPDLEDHWIIIGIQLTLFIGGGVSLFGLVVQDVRRRRDPDAVFLLLWVLGTFVFAGFVNWTTNVRSVLPVIPAAAIILARRLETVTWDRKGTTSVAIALAAAAIPALWVAAGDAALANAGRQAAMLINQKVGKSGTLWFEGHWGFQYYMEALGGHPVDAENPHMSGGDYVAIASNNVVLRQEPAPASVSAREVIEIDLPLHVTTIERDMAAGFYSSSWGPLPFSFGPVAPERYDLFKLASRRKNPDKSAP